MPLPASIVKTTILLDNLLERSKRNEEEPGERVVLRALSSALFLLSIRLSSYWRGYSIAKNSNSPTFTARSPVSDQTAKAIMKKYSW
jgi:hypothetical protein